MSYCFGGSNCDRGFTCELVEYVRGCDVGSLPLLAGMSKQVIGKAKGSPFRAGCFRELAWKVFGRQHAGDEESHRAGVARLWESFPLSEILVIRRIL